MPRRFSEAEVSALLRRLGFARGRQRGSHVQYRGRFGERERHVTLVARQRQIPPRTLRSIAAQLGVTADELAKML
jgi:predicted RNA binding protein YcfA (HicA-like mRNA interferase family)